MLGYLAMLLDPVDRRGCGGAIRAFVSMLVETVLAALMAPVVMYVQSRGVAECCPAAIPAGMRSSVTTAASRGWH